MANKSNTGGTLSERLTRLADLDRRYRRAIEDGDELLALGNAAESLAADADFGVAWVGQPDHQGVLTISVVQGARTPLLQDLVIAPLSGLTGKVFARERVEWVDQYFEATSITHDFDRLIYAEGIDKLIAVPVIRNDRIVGVLAAGSRWSSGSFSDRSIEHVVTSANTAALAGAVADRTRQAAEIAAHEERRRVAVDLHDSVGAMLYAITAGVRGLSDDAANEELRKRLETLESQACAASRLLRESLRTLYASPTELALSVALQGDCHSFEQRSGILAHLMTLGELPELPAARMSLVIGAVREALLNVEKHAQATTVAVTISAFSGELVVAVTDDGVGIGSIDDSDDCGIGLSSIAESLAQVGGRLELRSAPFGGGTVWRASLPL